MGDGFGAGGDAEGYLERPGRTPMARSKLAVFDKLG